MTLLLIAFLNLVFISGRHNILVNKINTFSFLQPIVNSLSLPVTFMLEIFQFLFCFFNKAFYIFFTYT